MFNVAAPEGKEGEYARRECERRFETRHSSPPLGVDVFEGELTGLVLGEAQFDDEDTLAVFVPPTSVVAEVTRDPRFTGGRLATTTAPELAGLLAERGLRTKD